MCPIIAKESVEIPTERYSGVIESVEIRRSQNDEGKIVEYVEMKVNTGISAVKGWNGVFKVSYPANLTRQTGFGKFLSRMGIAFTVGQSFDEQSLKGQRVSFDTRRDGNFTNPILEGVGPAK